eukprot:m.693454 g.693454  ORF g.693454 m.693454 type:complete len:181 (+) comp58655_c0_seq40:1261-1803(+)
MRCCVACRGWYVINSWMPLYLKEVGVSPGLSVQQASVMCQSVCLAVCSSLTDSLSAERLVCVVAADVGYYAVIPYMVMIVVDNTWSQVADSLIVRHGYTILAVRKLSQALSTLGPMLTLTPFILVEYLTVWWAVLWFSLSVALGSCSHSGFFPNFIDIGTVARDHVLVFESSWLVCCMNA